MWQKDAPPSRMARAWALLRLWVILPYRPIPQDALSGQIWRNPARPRSRRLVRPILAKIGLAA